MRLAFLFVLVLGLVGLRATPASAADECRGTHLAAFDAGRRPRESLGAGRVTLSVFWRGRPDHDQAEELVTSALVFPGVHHIDIAEQLDCLA